MLQFNLMFYKKHEIKDDNISLISLWLLVMGPGQKFLTQGLGHFFCCSGQVGSALSGSGLLTNFSIFFTFGSKKSHQAWSKNTRVSPLFTAGQ